MADVVVQEYGYRMAPGSRFGVELIQQTTSNGKGEFELSPPSGSVMTQAPAFLVGKKPGLAAAWLQFNRAGGAEPKLVLTTSSFMAGQVVDEADKPVANAEVSVLMVYSETANESGGRSMNYLSDQAARDLFKVKTGRDGRFRIDGFPTNSSAALVAEAPGKAMRPAAMEYFSPDTMPCRAGQEDIRLTVEPAGSVAGQIAAEGPGDLPVAQLTVSMNGRGAFWGTRSVFQSQPDHTFLIEGLPAGSYNLQAIFGTNNPPEWVAEPVPISVESGQAARDIKISAVRGGILEVAVRGSKDSSPLADAGVAVYRNGYQSAVTSGTNGVAVLRLPPGDYQVNAYKQGWQPSNVSGNVQPAQTNHVEIELAPAHKLAGVVRLPDNKPGANLPLMVIGDYGMQQGGVKTDADGKFDFEWSVQRFGGNNNTPCLLIRDPERNLAVAQDLDEDTEKLELKLAPAVSFATRVECDGKPVTNATANLLFRTGNMGMYLPNVVARTNTPGQVEIGALPPGRQYALQISAPGFGSKYIELGQQADEAKRVELDPVELKRADRKLAGQLLDTDDKPVAGATVQLNGEGQPNSHARTDKEGRFTFEVCEGTVRIFANSRQSFANVTAEAGDTNVVMHLGERGGQFGGGAKPQKLQGTVTDAAGKAVAGAEIRVFPMEMPNKAKTDTNGAFRVTYVVQPWMRQNGNPLLIVRDRAHNLAAAQEVTEDSTNMTVQVEAGLTVKGRVVGPDAKPLANAMVNLILQSSRMGGQVDDQPASTDAQGNYTFNALPAGQDYRIIASYPNYSQKNQKVEVEWDTNSVEMPPIVLRVADQWIAGKVVDSKDKPLSGIYVGINSDNQPQNNMQTDSKGRFKFKVCDGSIQLFASGQAGYAQATAQSGDTNVVIQLADRSMRMASASRRSSATTRAKPNNVPALKGKPLPDLASLGFAADTVPHGKPLLVCLMNIQQRPSRRAARLLADQEDAIEAKGVAVVGAQTVPASDDSWNDWKSAYNVRFPVARPAEKSDANKWASSLDNLPWLILVDKKGTVVDEGFAVEDLEAKLQQLDK